GWTVRPLGHFLGDALRTAGSLEAGQPWWLLLLGLLPVVVLLSFRSLAGLGPVRRWLAIGLRCTILLLLILALAEVRLTHRNETVTVLFVIARSYSAPEEVEGEGQPVDRRWERVKKFVNDAVALRGRGHERDQAGLIVFGRRPRLELPPASVPRFNFS